MAVGTRALGKSPALEESGALGESPALGESATESGELPDMASLGALPSGPTRAAQATNKVHPTADQRIRRV
jgi:hypothetical protein